MNFSALYIIQMFKSIVTTNLKYSYTMLKRLFDIFFSLIILNLTSPLLLLSAVVIKITSPGPIIYKQIRVGRQGKLFKIYKLRTMIKQADVNSNQLTLANDRRITPIGQLLRKFKLDEIPQLFNVLKGEMSVVGPRPDVPGYFDLQNSLHQKILTVKPGITSRASIKYSLTNSSNESKLLSKSCDPETLYRQQIFADKIRLNAEYVDRQSFLNDLKIIWQTFIKIIHSA